MRAPITHRNTKNYVKKIYISKNTKNVRSSIRIAIEAHRVGVVAGNDDQGIVGVDDVQSGVDSLGQSDGFQKRLGSVSSVMSEVYEATLNLGRST